MGTNENSYASPPMNSYHLICINIKTHYADIIKYISHVPVHGRTAYTDFCENQ